jgi:hypothetical protein
MDQAQLQRITMDRFTFVTQALQAAGEGFVSHLSIDSGQGSARCQRFFTFKPIFESAESAQAYALDQASHWMKYKSLG